MYICTYNDKCINIHIYTYRHISAALVLSGCNVFSSLPINHDMTRRIIPILHLQRIHPDMETLDWHFDMFYLRRRINVASGTGTVWLPTLRQNLQGTYPRINQHVIFQPRRNVNKTHPGKGGHTFNLHLYKTACHRRLATRYWLNYSTIDTTCMFNHRSCLMKCFIGKDVEGLDSDRWIPLGGCTRIPRGL